MTAYGLNPTFTDRDSYKAWRKSWSQNYKRLSGEIRALKVRVKNLNRQSETWFSEEKDRVGCWPVPGTNAEKTRPECVAELEKAHRDLLMYRSMGSKMMSLLDDAKERRDRILKMRADLKEQEAMFPLDLGECRNVDFHFNKGHLEFPFLPMWTVRAKGRTYYVNEVEFDAPCTTRERANGTTKGVLRFARARVVIEAGGMAKITLRAINLVDQSREVAA